MPLSDSELIDAIRKLGPWHLDVQLTETVSTASAYGNKELERDENEGISLLSLKKKFDKRVEMIYPGGMEGKTFMDCACNAGGYCFWAKEHGVKSAYGFDIRQHWIDQANFIKEHRTVGDSDGIEFQQMDLYDLPKKNLEPVDFMMFKGIFYHLPFPVDAVKTVADLTKEVILFNTATFDDGVGNSLVCAFENPGPLMSGVHTLSWVPSGPKVIAKMLYWLGFVDIRLIFWKPGYEKTGRGRMELIAAKSEGILDAISDRPECRRLHPEKAITW